MTPFRSYRVARRRRHLIAEVMRTANVSEAVATRAVAEAASQRPFLDWLKSLDWAAILKLALALLPLLLAEEDES